MEAFWAWCVANPEVALTIGAVAVDLIAGALPDKFTKWPGIILTAANKAFYFGKEGAPPEARKLDEVAEQAAERALHKAIEWARAKRAEKK